MSFPISPTNGQLATVNGIVFSYNSASFSWTRTASALSGVANLVVTNNANLTNIYSSVGNFTGNLIAAGIVGTTYYGQINLGTTSVNLNRTSGSQTLTGVAIDGTAATATNAINTQVTSNISAGTAYITFVNATSGNVAQNLNTALTYNPNSGNLRAYGIQTDTGIFWAGNGVPFSSGGGGNNYTANTAPPTVGNVAGDMWYDTSSDILYEYLDDGTSKYWVDTISAGNIQATSVFALTIGDATLNGNILASASNTYSIGSSSNYLNQLFVNRVNAAGNVQANYVLGDGSKLTNTVTTGKAIAMSIVFGG